MMWQKSICKGPWLHRFVLVGGTDRAIKEVCQVCHLAKFFVTRLGRSDNREYLAWHLRSALQPRNARFRKEYPNFS
jgi:hypothetical protein